MASLMKQKDRFYCQFLTAANAIVFPSEKWTGKKQKQNRSAQTNYLLMRLRQGLLQIPPGMDIVSFLQFDGKAPQHATVARDAITLKFLRDEHLKVHKGSLEATTTDGMELHFKHIMGSLGEGFPLNFPLQIFNYTLTGAPK